LYDWLKRTPPALVAQHLNIEETKIAMWPDKAPLILPD
jgi:oxalate decarboxylase